jgi:hypothetical protein
MSPHEDLYRRLQDRAEIRALIGKTEDLRLDCKIWPLNDDDGQRVLAKALSGFANADGGVVLIGMEAKPLQKFDPDLISTEKPVSDAIALKSRIEALIGDLVEPGLRGVEVAAVLEHLGSKPGFVLVHVPPTDGSPVRSRKDWHFYQRIASGTYRMEYFQLADMFGRRRRPSLALSLENAAMQPRPVGSGVYQVLRTFTLGLKNNGRGVAKFPSVRLKADQLAVNPNGVDGNGFFGLDRLPSEPGWLAFGGGADHVIYPGITLRIAKLEQRARMSQCQPASANGKVYVCDEINISAELFADDVESRVEVIRIPEEDFQM